jgi:2-dehydro-3-deoxy-D-arabinonate dehydratase
VTGYLGLAADDFLDGPLALSRAETYDGCCAVGPCLTTPEDLEGIDRLQMRLSVIRGGAESFSQAFPSPALPEAARAGSHLRAERGCRPATLLAIEPRADVHPSLALRQSDRLDLEIQAVGRLSVELRAAS